MRYILVFVLAALAGCRPELVPSVEEEEYDCPLRPGEQVTFLTGANAPLSTKAFYPVAGYDPVTSVSRLYDFNVEMYREGGVLVGRADYMVDPALDNTDGTLLLKAGQTPLFWEDNVNRFGFRATAGRPLSVGTDGYCDQSTEDRWFSYDMLEGYAAVGHDGADINDPKEALNYHLIKEWFNQNKDDYTYHGLAASDKDMKKIPLYLRHNKALITVILKAAEGVKREDLRFLTQADNIDMRIFSKSGSDEAVPVLPLAEEAEVAYEVADINGPAGTFPTTKYHAIVEPYNYLNVADTDPVCTINLSGQKFSYYASSDREYKLWEGNHSNYPRIEEAYNLAAGKHLVITATLSRESRKILMTAYVEDWTEQVTSTICDDYGKNGDPIQISSADALAQALASDISNSNGNVLLLTNDVTLPDGWASTPLNCMLNLAGRTLTTSKPVFTDITSKGSVVNGTISVTAPVDHAVAQTNHGTIERVELKAADATVKAGSGAFVHTNYKTIYNCASDIPVYGTSGYVGGVAAESLQGSESGAPVPIIDGCTVSAKVDGAGVTAGGGIVGNATGRVTNNSYEYGVTISQDANVFKSDVGHDCSQNEQRLNNTGNAYPLGYSGFIDSQKELAMLFETVRNSSSHTYRVSGDFTVDNTWDKGIVSTELGATGTGNVFFSLDGNGRTITLTSSEDASAPMLFTNVQNTIRDLTLYVEKPVYAPYSVTGSSSAGLSFDNFSAKAPLAYAVVGATLSNVKVYTAADAYISASNAGGIAVWAYNGAKFDGCEFYGTVKAPVSYPSGVNLDTDMSNLAKGSGVLASGGIAAAAEKASFTGCAFHSGSGYAAPEGKDKDYSYFGGILGAVVDGPGTDVPEVVLQDCTSYLEGTGDHKGALAGYSVYKLQDGSYSSGIKSGDCQGNWWRTTENTAVARRLTGRTDVHTIGKRNSVQPSLDRTWFEKTGE